MKAIGFSGVQNFPTVGLIDGMFRANLEETGMGYALEVEMIAKARAKDLLTTPYVFNEAEAEAMAAAGRRHHRLPHGPDHRRRDRRADRAKLGRLPGADRRLGGAALAVARRSGARARRPDRRAGGRGFIMKKRKTATASMARPRWSGCRSSAR